MSLKNMTLAESTTGVTFAGGNPLVFAEDGMTIQNGVHLFVPADTSFKLRRQATAKVRQAVFDPKTGSYSKMKRSLSIVIPTSVDPNSTVVYNTVRLEVEFHPEVTGATVSELLLLGAQGLTDSDLESFWNAGSLA